MDLMECVKRHRVEGVQLQALGSQEEPIVGGTLVVTAFFFIFTTRKTAGQDEFIVRKKSLYVYVSLETTPTIEASRGCVVASPSEPHPH